ncbi:hypothetical protein DL771_005389 [Monosporascus sp. 5C6A]|nr:hypothetical protein DL771_005389 [Monosporascus sp. 5C6A]
MLLTFVYVLLTAVLCTAQDLRFRTYGGPVTIGNHPFPYRRGGLSYLPCAVSKTGGAEDQNCLADFFTVGQINDRHNGPYADLDDCDVFLRWGFLRDSRPRRFECSLDTDFSVTNWIKTTRCYDQIGSDKYEELLRGEGIFTAAKYILPFGKFGVKRGQEYKRDVLQQIFDSEKGSLQALILNAYNAHNASRAVAIEIGNEPNVHPAMAPETYGWYVKMYADAIRKAAAELNKALPNGKPAIQVKIMAAGLWVFEGMPEYVLEALGRGFHMSFGSLFFKVPTGVRMCSVGRSWWKVKVPCGVKYKDIELTEGFDLKSTFYIDLLAYWRKVLNAAGPGTIDIANLHFYPYIAEGSHTAMPKHLETLRSFAAEMARGVSSREVWLTEIGNINPYGDAEATTKVMVPMMQGLRAGPPTPISHWYWFRTDGSDKKFDLIPSQTKWATGVWASIFAFLDLSLGHSPIGIINFKEPDMTTEKAARVVEFIGRLKANKPAQGLFDVVGGNQTLMELGETYYKFAMGEL